MDRFDDPNADRVRRRVLGWLGVIARRNAIHRVRSLRDRHLALRPDEVSGAGAAAEPPSRLTERLDRALTRLSSEELEVLQVSLPWYDLESQQFRLPRGEASKIAATLQVSVDTLRQRRHRSLTRLRTLLGQEDE